MKQNYQEGSAHVVVTIALVLALIAALGFIFWQNFIHKDQVVTATNTVVAQKPSSSTQTAQSTTSNPSVVLAHVQTFYQKHLSTVGSSGSGTFLPSDWLSQGFITQSFYNQQQTSSVDLTTCSQNPLPYTAYTFGTPVVTGTTASMTLTGTYAGPPSTSITVSLDLVNDGGTWKINIASCPA